MVTFALALFGFALAIAALFIRRSPLTFAAVIMGSGIIFVIVAGMLSRWFRKYGRRRSRHGNLARGQGFAMFAFLGWLLNGAMFLVHFGLTAVRWKGF